MLLNKLMNSGTERGNNANDNRDSARLPAANTQNDGVMNVQQGCDCPLRPCFHLPWLIELNIQTIPI